MIERLRSWLRPIGTPESEPETTSYDPRLEHPEPTTTWREIRVPVIDGVATLPNGRKVFGDPGVREVVFLQLNGPGPGVDWVEYSFEPEGEP